MAFDSIGRLDHSPVLFQSHPFVNWDNNIPRVAAGICRTEEQLLHKIYHTGEEVLPHFRQKLFAAYVLFTINLSS